MTVLALIILSSLVYGLLVGLALPGDSNSGARKRVLVIPNFICAAAAITLAILVLI